ncbi:hypothetical protein [Prochlorococcus sp. MIT 1300]|uniref:hypothetical protein n=1 Tax=Prochlorococcus sp. MIT 1300 TaxID=3096218 RepID=UPI002A760EF8|nr:hypothetical protein [Prochlorococcus sp. MIT 1300]
MAMDSASSSSKPSIKEQLKQLLDEKWESLNQSQKKFAKKVWGIITYKWRWQIAMNIPYLAIFILDKTIPSVHKFDVELLSYITAKLPIPAFISSWIGLN